MSRWRALLLLVFSSCSLLPGPADVTAATLFQDGVTLQLMVAVCASDASATVTESEDSVTVSVTAKRKAGDCGIGVNVTLDDQLGDRQLIDAYDGEAVDVRVSHGDD